VIAGFIVQSLFILVILQALEKANEQNSWNMFKKLTKKFKETWGAFALEGDPYKMQSDNLLLFFKQLNEPLGKYQKLN